jgi:predicted RNase H-like HicB family nuclease
MQIPVVIEPVAGNGYRARGGEPFALSAEGATPGEALQNLRERIQGHLAGGVQLATLDLPSVESAWLRLGGIFKDDPWFDRWQQAIEDYRRQVDEDPDRL